MYLLFVKITLYWFSSSGEIFQEHKEFFSKVLFFFFNIFFQLWVEFLRGQTFVKFGIEMCSNSMVLSTKRMRSCYTVNRGSISNQVWYDEDPFLLKSLKPRENVLTVQFFTGKGDNIQINLSIIQWFWKKKFPMTGLYNYFFLYPLAKE